MATVTKPIALDESFNTTEVTPRNIADVLAEELSRITGRNASQVEYDNTESGLTADNVQDALDEINGKIPTVPSVDVQTAVDEFETYNGGILSSLKVSLSPNQDLHGYDSPWVGGAGKNKLPLVLADIKANNISGTWSGNVYSKDGIDFTILTDDADNVLGINANGTATSQVGITVTYYAPISAGSYILNGTASGSGWTTSWLNVRVNTTNYNDIGSGASFTVSEASTMTAYCYIASGTTISNKTFNPMIRLASESDPTFEPYSNICPISGHTQVDVDVSDGQTTQEQVTVNLGGIYYSGTLDVVTGVFTPDTASIVFDGSENWSGNASWNNHSFVLNNALPNAVSVSGYSTKANIISNLAGVETPADVVTTNLSLVKVGVGQGAGSSLYANLGDEFDTVTKFKNFLSNNNLQIIYELANPTPIQLSPTMVKALVGENHLSAPLDGQEITESKYKQMFTFDDVIAYIQSLS